MRIKILSSLAAVSLSSCIAFHSGNVSSGPLMNINDRYAETVTGSAKSLSVLVFSDNQYQLIADARRDLFRNRKLSADEYFANFSVDIRKDLIFGIVYATRVIVSADIMRNRSAGESVPFVSLPSKSGTSYFIWETDTFRLGEAIYYTRNKSYYKSGRIDTIKPDEITLYDEASGTLKELKSPRHFFYSTINVINGFHAGDRVLISDFDPISNKKKSRPAVILGLNSSEALLDTDRGRECHPYSAFSKMEDR